MSYTPGDLTAFLNPKAEAKLEAVERAPARPPRAEKGRKRKEPEADTEEAEEGEQEVPRSRATKRKRGEVVASSREALAGSDSDGEGEDGGIASMAMAASDAEDESDDSDGTPSAGPKRAIREDGALRRMKLREKKEKEAKAEASGEKKKEKASPEDDERLPRTVFVGNVPVTATRKEVAALFAPYSSDKPIVRLRSIPRETPKLPAKAAIVTGRLHPERDTMHAYVVLDSAERVPEAVEALNGTLFQGKHLRVDAAGNASTHDTKRSVFIGNLAFDASEDDLRQHFVDLGLEGIEGVRVVRDKATSAGKGFGFLLFKDSTGAKKALAANGTAFKGRPLRVTRAATPDKLQAAAEKARAKGTGKGRGSGSGGGRPFGKPAAGGGARAGARGEGGFEGARASRGTGKSGGSGSVKPRKSPSAAFKNPGKKRSTGKPKGKGSEKGGKGRPTGKGKGSQKRKA